MSDANTQQKIPYLDYQRPSCPTCGLPMWLTEVEYISSDPLNERLHFECKVCEAKAIISPLA